MQKSNILDRFFSFLIGILVTLVSGYLLYSSGIVSSVVKLTDISTIEPPVTRNDANNTKAWELPKSTKQGFPDSQEGKLYIYDIENRELRSTNIPVNWGSGAMDLGETTPEASPDLLYTAYIDENTKELWIMSNETLEKVKVPNSQNVTYITGWSPDSKTLVYYFAPRNITSAKDGMMVDFNVVEKFDNKAEYGFYALEISSGKVTHLKPLDNVVAVLSSSEVITRFQENRLVIFDIQNYTADYGTVQDLFGFGEGQFNFSKDGTVWTFISSENPTEDMHITKAQFPNKTGTIVDSGAWADVQWPVLSSDGKLIAYQRHEYSDEFKSNIAGLWWINEEGRPEKLGMGRPLAWVNNETLIIEKTVSFGGKMVAEKALFHIPTRKTYNFTMIEI